MSELLRRLWSPPEDGLTPQERGRHRERLVLAPLRAETVELVAAVEVDTPTAALPLDQARTAALPAVTSKLDRGCRTKLANGKRCGHATAAHQQVGFYAGERERCFCGCTAYRQPWFDFVLTVAAVVIFVALLFLLLMATS